jgi:hypothetical protein
LQFECKNGEENYFIPAAIFFIPNTICASGAVVLDLAHGVIDVDDSSNNCDEGLAN